MLFRIGREVAVEPLDPPESAVDKTVIPPGEVVRLIPELARETTAHVMWRERCYVVDRAMFLSGASPLGPAPD